MNIRLQLLAQSVLAFLRSALSRKDLVFILLAVIGTLMSLVLLIKLLTGAEQEIQIKGEEETGNLILPEGLSGEKEAEDGVKEEKQFYLWLEIAGAIKKPGIYLLPMEKGQNGRLYELVNLAGGFTREADIDYLNQKLNLTEVLSDGQKIYIPFVGEAEETKLVSEKGTTEVKKEAAKGKVSVNNAEINELKNLTGVGEVRASKIVEGRPYQSLQELVDEKIITQKIMDDNKEQLVL